MAAVSFLKDILHSMFNIEDKLQDSHVKIKSTGQQFYINSFFSNCSKLFCDNHIKK